MYVYQSKQFAERAADRRVAARIQKIIYKLEQHTTPVRDNNVPFFTGRYGPRYLKREEKEYRIVAELLNVDGAQVVYLHQIFFDHKYDYTWFLGEMKAKRTPYETDLAAVKAYVRQQRAQEEKRQSETLMLQPLPEGFAGWLQRPKWESDWVIYEGHEWVSRFRKKEFLGRWETLCEIIEEITGWVDRNNLIDLPAETTSGNVEITVSSVHLQIRLAQKGDRGVLFSIHSLPLPIETRQNLIRPVIFLLAPYENQPTDSEIQNLVEKYYPFFTKPQEEPLEFNDIAHCADRVYPYYIPWDHDLWGDIEKEEGVNLALSAEEEQILLSLSDLGPDDYRLPIFINGRAGSGKSTILFYLFAEYCARLLDKTRRNGNEDQDLTGIPLFLTYNQELLKVARDRIKRMLKTRLAGALSQEELDQHLSPMLKPFREFLRELLPDDNENTYFFKDAQRVTFYEFKQLYSKRLFVQEAMKYSPDLCWYIIRTFIKGYNLDGYLDPEGYSRIPRKEQVVSLEVFEAVHRIIWSWYKKLLDDEGKWDDQDLIRAVLECGAVPKVDYSAIFCDEAQDFTRLEIHFILQASVFARYDLSELKDIPGLPFAFAGDPLQTLNPTGFRWAGLQSMFHEQIIQSVDPNKFHNLVMKHLDDLNYNYRSTQPIVETTNAILLVRNHIFGQHTRPQLFWGKGKAAFLPRKFLLEQISIPELKKQIQDTIILIPCDEGGESAFINADPLLSGLYPDASLDKLPRNVLSAIGSKGLEFKRVILYKFGEACPKKVWRETIQPGHQIEAEYFFNKLYVAATRAMHWIFVIDSDEGEENLWNYMDEQALIRYAMASKTPEAWSVRPAHDENSEHSFIARSIRSGTNEDLTEISEDEPELVAKEFKDKGISTGNADHMRRAASYYRTLRDSQEADLCEAYSLKFEGDLKQAGECFMKLHQLDLARECYWQGELWSELLTVKSVLTIENRELVKFMDAQRGDTDAILNFTQFLEDILAADRMAKAISRQWRSGIQEFSRRICLISATKLSKDNWRRLGLVMEELNRLNYQTTLSSAGICYFNADQYLKAIQSWDAGQDTQHQGYYLAKSNSLRYPLNLEWWEKAGDTKQIYQEWMDHGGLNQTDARVLRSIAPILVTRKRYWDAAQVYIRLSESDPKKVKNVLNRINEVTPGMVESRQEVRSLVVYLGGRNQWEFLINFLEKLQKPIKEVNERMEIRYEIIRQLANAELSGDLLDSGTTRRIYSAVIKPVADSQAWQKSLSFDAEFGPAVEILGFDQSLRFYDRFMDDEMNPDIRNYARARWLANAEMKYDHHIKNDGEVRDQSFLKKYGVRKRDWKIEAGSWQSSEGDERIIVEEVIRQISPIQGVPADIPIKETTSGDRSFDLAGIQYVVRKDRRIVKLEDQDFQNIIFDFSSAEIKPTAGFDVIQENSPDGRIFSVPDWNLVGKLASDEEEVFLEIASKGLAAPITIRL